MFLVDTLYVQPDTSMSMMKSVCGNKELTEGKDYKVIHSDVINNVIHLGVINNNSKMSYYPYNLWLILDSKTRKLAIPQTKGGEE
jgi:hypothetical protein